MSNTPAPIPDAPPEASALMFTILGSIPRMILFAASLLYPTLSHFGVAKDVIDAAASGLTPIVLPIVAAVLSILWSHVDNTRLKPILLSVLSFFKGSQLMLFSALLFACVVACGLMGCAQTEKNKIAQAYTTIDATARTTTGLLKSHTLTLQQAAKIKEACDVAAAAVDAWDAARGTNNATLLEKSQQAALAALTQLSLISTQNLATPPPATQPQ